MMLSMERLRIALAVLFVLSPGCGRGASPRTEAGGTAPPPGSSAVPPIQPATPSNAAVVPPPPVGGDHMFREAEMSGMKVGILRTERGGEREIPHAFINGVA